MNTIAAILVYLGIATSATDVTADMVIYNSDVILDTADDPSFVNYYESQYGTDYHTYIERTKCEVVISDIREGD